MAKQTLWLNNFSGGLSDDDKFGPPNSYAEGVQVDHRLSPGILAPRKELFPEAHEGANDGVVNREIVDAARVSNGDVYFGGTSGLFRRAVSTNAGVGAYSVVSGSLSAACSDLVYHQATNALLVIGSYYISELSFVTGSPVWTFGKYFTYDAFSQTASGGLYNVPTAISEADGDKFPFVCKAEPANGVMFYLSTKGAGDLKVIVHDAANNVVLQATRINLSLSVGVVTNSFWDTPNFQGRLNVGSAYHVHFTSTAAGHQLLSTAANNLPTAQFSMQAKRLVDMSITDSVPGYIHGHRSLLVGSKIYICNERYLGEWELLNNAANNTDGYYPHRLVFPANFVTCGLTEYNDYLAIAASINDGSDSIDTSGSSGMIFLWDKASTFYNFALPVPDGVPNSLFSKDNMLHWESKGRLYRWGGGDIEVLYEFPGVSYWQAATGAPQSEVYLRAPRIGMAAWEGLLVVGFPRTTANLNVKYGVYSYGRKKSSSALSMGYDYVPTDIPDGQVKFGPSGTPTSPVTAITMVKKFGSNLFVATKNRIGSSTVYNIDYTNDAQGYSEAGSWASLWFDAGAPGKFKTFMSVIITFKELPINATIVPKVRFDRDTAWRTDVVAAMATVGDKIVRLTLPVETSRFLEAQVGFDWTNDSTTGDKPEVISLGFEYDDNAKEENNAT